VSDLTLLTHSAQFWGSEQKSGNEHGSWPN